VISRRKFLSTSSALILAGCNTTPLGLSRSDDYPFTLGVASGDPRHDSMILWTRLAPRPLLSTALTSPVLVTWGIARDPGMNTIVASGEVLAMPDNAHSVHVEAKGLSPDQTYYYQFETMGHSSPLGRTRTFPAPGARTEKFTIALTSCQEYSLGYFSAYQDVVAKNPNLVVHNGDYIYEAPSGEFRSYPFESDAFTLDEYRSLYALYKQDRYLQAAHAALPWHVIWDDHEVVNDWGPDHFIPTHRSRPVTDEQHQIRKKMATKAFLEHMPLRAAMLPTPERFEPILYSQSVIGDLLELNHLDVRSYRSPPVCYGEKVGRFEHCLDLEDSRRSILGDAQEQWLFSHLGKSGCQWNCISQTTMMARLDRAAGPVVRMETDSWDNYPATRERIVSHIEMNRIRNAISLGGNIHAFYAGVVPSRQAVGSCDPVLTEVVTSSVSAGGGGDERYDDIHGRRSENPCIEFFDNRVRGYTHMTFNRERVSATFRGVKNIQSHRPDTYSLASLSIRDGDVGLHFRTPGQGKNA
jgi:alkaline phosphatase D